MDKSEQRIALAEFEGWRIYQSNGIIYYEKPGGNVQNYTFSIDDLPNYLEDLNAIHKLEEKLDDQQKDLYIINLTEGWRSDKITSYFDAIHSNSEWRCKCLLKTLKLWEND